MSRLLMVSLQSDDPALQATYDGVRGSGALPNLCHVLGHAMECHVMVART